jgi:trigger factor
MDGILDAYARVAQVSGFRPGKAPARVIEQRFSRQIQEDAKDRLIPRFYREALAGEKLQVVGIVGLSDVVLDRGKGLAFKATVDVAPEFRLPRYRKIPLREAAVEVSDADVDKALLRLRESLARFEDVAGRPAQRGDLVRIDFRGESEGRPVQELAPACAGLGEGKDFWALLDEPEFLPGFVDGIAGMQVGHEKAVTVRFPADFRVKEVAGRTAAYQVVLRALRERRLPAVDAEFLKTMEVETEQALRDGIRRRLTEAAQQNERNRLRNDIARYLLEKTAVDIPQSVAERERALTARNMAQNIALHGGTEEDIQRHRGDILSAAERTSAERVKLSYILAKIAGAEGIGVEDAEVDARVAQIAGRRGMTPERLRAELEEDDGVEWIRAQARAEKTLDYLLAEARLSDGTRSPWLAFLGRRQSAPAAAGGTGGGKGVTA